MKRTQWGESWTVCFATVLVAACGGTVSSCPGAGASGCTAIEGPEAGYVYVPHGPYDAGGGGASNGGAFHTGGTAPVGGSSSSTGGTSSGGATTMVDASADAKGGATSMAVEAGPHDTTPPVFAAGTGTALVTSTSLDLVWPDAHDDSTPDVAIRYRVYVSTASGEEDYAAPLVTVTGVTSTVIEGSVLLSAFPEADAGTVADRDFYIVIVAVDVSGNHGEPLAEVHVGPAVLFESQIQPIFTRSCAVAGCHVHATPTFNPPLGMVMEDGYAYDSITNVVAKQGQQLIPPEPTLKRIDATTNVPSDSYLWRKIRNQGNITGTVMPPPGAAPLLGEPFDFNLIETWIKQGAPRN